ncbi:hypothetical protein PIB30_096190 [Stylosanthes scabra]|uniref:Uncharacterized protein n=1 Tax=Stylosanthes scabra TaxID=79078 RepID=A0ABU6UVC9_9FABA|nr:hypothetical protein [Stylosanthes scabra]
MPLITLNTSHHYTQHSLTLTLTFLSPSQILSFTKPPTQTHFPTPYAHQSSDRHSISGYSLLSSFSSSKEVRIALIGCRLWHSQGIQARSWVTVGELRRTVIGFKCLQEVRRIDSKFDRGERYDDGGCKSIHFLVFTLFIELINVLRVTLRESKHHVGAYGANDSADDNSGLSDAVDDWGVFGLMSQLTGRYIRNIKERNPLIYMIKRKTVNGWGIERGVLGEVRPIVVRD